MLLESWIKRCPNGPGCAQNGDRKRLTSVLPPLARDVSNTCGGRDLLAWTAHDTVARSTSQSHSPRSMDPALDFEAKPSSLISVSGGGVCHRYFSCSRLRRRTLFAASAAIGAGAEGGRDVPGERGEACARERGLSLRLRPADAEARGLLGDGLHRGGGGLLSTGPAGRLG